MKRLVAAAMAFMLLAATVPGVLAQDQSTSAATPDVDVPPVTWVDDAGNPVAELTVTDVERGWSDYSQPYAPLPGNEYLRLTIQVESMVASGSLVLDPYMFIVQNVDGYVSQGNVVPTAEEDASGSFDYSGVLDLSGGESGEIIVTFQVFEGTRFEAVYFIPDSPFNRLITVMRFDTP